MVEYLNEFSSGPFPAPRSPALPGDLSPQLLSKRNSRKETGTRPCFVFYRHTTSSETGSQGLVKVKDRITGSVVFPPPAHISAVASLGAASEATA